LPDYTGYAAIKPITQGGIIMFENLHPDEEETIVELAIAGGITGEEETKVSKPVEAHTPFEFSFAGY